MTPAAADDKLTGKKKPAAHQAKLHDMKAAQWTPRGSHKKQSSEMETKAMDSKGAATAPGVLIGKSVKDVEQLGFDLYDASQNYTVDYLFGGLDGAPLIEKIMEFFAVEELDVLPWFFDDSGSMCRTIVRSPLSRPIQERTVTRYMQRVLQEGLSQRVAGLLGGVHCTCTQL